MDSQGHTHATESAARAGFDGGQPVADTGNPGPSPGESFRESLRQFGEIREYAAYYVAAKIDALRLGIRNIIVLAALGLIGLIAASAVIVTAVVLALLGIAGALTGLMPAWAANLVIGVLVLLAVALGVLIVMSRLMKSSRRQTVEKYESRKHRQQTEFGHDVEERAEQHRPS